MVTVGGTVYYAGWDPFWRNENRFEMMPPFINKIDGQYVLKAAAPIYGPVIAVGFNEKWGLSLSGLFGTYRYDYSGNTILMDLFAGINSRIFPTQKSRLCYKYDGDLLANYSIERHTRLFFGLKYQGYHYRENGYDLFFSVVMPIAKTVTYHSGGIGLGILNATPLGKGFFIQTQVSFQAMAGAEQTDGYGTAAILACLGGNATGGIAYHITPAHLTIALGGRIQYQYYYRYSTINRNSRSDIFYGAYLSLMALF